MEQQYQQFCQLVASQVGVQSQGDIRQQGEQALNNIKDQDPNNFILFHLAILKENQEASLRTFSITQVKCNLSMFSESSYTNIWSKLQESTKTQVKSQLFEFLISETSPKIRKLICQAIGEIGATLEEQHSCPEDNQGGQNAHEWSDLLGNVWKMFMQENNVVLESAFWVLSNLICYNPDLFEKNKNDLYTLFKNGVQNPSRDIQSAAIECLGSYISVCDSKVLKDFDTLIPSILESTYLMLQNDSDTKGEEALDVIEQIVESEPKFFRRNFEIFFQMVQKIFALKDLEKTIKQQAVDIVMEIIKKIPKVILDKPTLISQLCELIFFLMVESDCQVTEEWKSPPEGFNDENEDDDEDSTKFGMNCIDRFISSLGEQHTLKPLGATVQTLLQHQDWKYQYAAIMALSQVGEYVEEVDTILPIIKLIVSYLNHENPKIRYAVCHSVGQIADDMKPDFQEKFYVDLLPALINICKDPVPRVSSHGYAAITNFVESIDKDLIKDYLEDILKISFNALQNGNSLCKENAVSTIAAASEAAKEYFVPYFSEAMPFLFKIYEGHTTKEYRQLRGQTIECITLIAHGVPKEVFTPYFEKTVNILVQLQESNLEQVDPQKSYVLSGWQRMCLVFGKELIPYLGKIIPSLYSLVSNVFQINTEGDANQANTYDKDEAEIAIHMLAVFIDQLKESFQPYVESTTELLVPLCQYEHSGNIRVSSSKCLSCLITCAKSQPNIALQLTKYFLDVLYKAMNNEYDTQIMCSQACSMKECLEEIDTNCFNDQELSEFAQKLFQVLLDSDKRKIANDSCKNDEDLDDEEIVQIEEETQLEEELHVYVAEVIGQLFRTHKQSCAPIALIIYEKILPQVLTDTVSDKMHKFGIYLICDMIEFLSYDLLKTNWNHLLEALIKFSSNKSLQVRQASIYGIGIFAQNTPQEIYASSQQLILDSLKTSLDTTNENQQKYQEKYNNKCKDNIVSAFGKIIKHQHQNVQVGDLINFWVQYLPLKYDRKEALVNHYLLCDIQLDSPQLLFGANPAQNISKILSVYAQILGTKLNTPTLQEKIKACMQALSQETYVKENWDNLVKDLTAPQKDKLKAILTNVQ